MTKLTSIVELNFGDQSICLRPSGLSYSSIYLNITKEQFQMLSQYNKGTPIGLVVCMTLICDDLDLEMRSNVYSARCKAFFRLSAEEYSLKFVFTNLDASKYRSIRKTIAKIG